MSLADEPAYKAGATNERRRIQRAQRDALDNVCVVLKCGDIHPCHYERLQNAIIELRRATRAPRKPR